MNGMSLRETSRGFSGTFKNCVPAREVRKGIEDGIVKPKPNRHKVQGRHEEMIDPLVDGEDMRKDLLGPSPGVSSDEGARRDRGIGLQRPRPFVPGSDSN